MEERAALLQLPKTSVSGGMRARRRVAMKKAEDGQESDSSGPGLLCQGRDMFF